MNEEPRRVMLVEEDETLGEITAFRLELLGYEVKTVTSAEAALEAIEEQKPDVAVVDLVQPEMTGIELIERLSRQEETKSIAVMALSIEADLDAVLLAYKAGAVDYLVAPYNPTVLEDKVTKLFERSRRDQLVTAN